MRPKKPKPLWDKERILCLLDANDKAVERGLLAIYRLQTESEQEAKDTIEHNGVGFTAFDARAMSANAEHLLIIGRLTPNRLSFVRKRLKKYANQLAKLANDKQPAHLSLL